MTALLLTGVMVLGGSLWIGVLPVFFPAVGQGFFGRTISPKLIVASLVPHVRFAVLLDAMTDIARRRI